MKNRISIILALVAFCIMAVSCKEDRPTIPAYLHLDKINVAHPADGSTSVYGDAFLTSEIDAVQVWIWVDGVDSSANLGTFQLPCTIPVLSNFYDIKKIMVYPIVKQNGIAGTHIYYPYYVPYIDSNLVIAPDSTTNIGTLDADGNYAISVRYQSASQMKILKSEFFEPLQLNIAFDSIVERVVDADTARSGQGYGRVHFTADESSKTFFIKDTLTENDPTSYLYLEMDYWTDSRLEVGMQSERLSGNSISLAGCVTLYPNKRWQKIYINLGKTWNYFNYNSKFKIAFSVLNLDKTEGFVRFDNVKILSY